MSSGRSFKLYTGQDIPAVGLGTWLSKPSEVKLAVEEALRIGYRHIDAAATYDNEEEVGAGIRASGVPRSDIFITSKLWNTHHEPEDVEPAVNKTLADLGTDYLDLFLMHWPVSFQKSSENEWTRNPINPETEAVHVTNVPLEDTWKAMEDLVRKGKVRAIGFSNFTRENTERILKIATIKPALSQFEAHPYFQQTELIKWLKSQGIAVAAYSPSGNNTYGQPKAVDDPVIAEIATKHNVQPAQVAIQWGVQRGTVVLPKSVTPSRIAANFQDFELPAEDMERINALDKNKRNNFPARLGVNIFGELDEETLKKGVQDWIAKQRELKAKAATT